MFTGIVEELGEVVTAETAEAGAARLRVRAPVVAADAAAGDSVAVCGVCLTVVGAGDGVLAADVSRETLTRSRLGTLSVGAPVNLERPLTLASLLGGHLLQGHVDGTGEVLGRTPESGGETVRVSLPARLARYVVEKGSIAVDGVSLTVVDVTEGSFTVSLIPATLERTTLGRLQPGESVNLEVDVVAKYVERCVETYLASYVGGLREGPPS